MNKYICPKTLKNTLNVVRSEHRGVYIEEVRLLSRPLKADGDEDTVILGRPARSGQEMHLRHVVVLSVQNLSSVYVVSK